MTALDSKPSSAQQLQRDFSTLTITLMAAAIVLNIVLGQVVALLKLPIFLDSLGTILVAVLAGPWAGALTGLLSNLIWGLLSDPVAAAFAPVAMMIGLAAGLCARYGLFKTWWGALVSGVIITLALSLVAVPIRLYMFGGLTGSGADFITAYMLQLGRDLFGAVIVQVISSNLIDKIATALLAWLILCGLPQRFVARFPRAGQVRQV